MSERHPALEGFDVLIGTWTIEATHPLFDGVVHGSITWEWLEGGHYIVQRSRMEHELFPDGICVIGSPEDGDGLLMEYFDSRGVRRTYDIALDDGVLRIWRDQPGFDQRAEAKVDREHFEMTYQLRREDGEWKDDLHTVYRRTPSPLPPGVSAEVFAGVRVRDFAAARAWYEQLLGEPSFLPHDTEAVWTLADGRSVYILEDAERAGSGLTTLFVDDLDAVVEGISSRGLEPAERETYSNGVRKVTYRDPDGNEIGFGGAPE